MADTKYYSILTSRGKALEAESTASGTPVVIQDFVIGDGNGQAVTPDPTRTALVNEVFRSAISSLEVSPDQANQFIAHLVIPASAGGFTVREAGLLTDAGELYAVANCAAIEKPVSGISISLQFRLAVSETADIELKVATGDGLFLRQDANLSDVVDKALARDNLELGTAAIKNVQLNKDDTTAGRVLVNGGALAVRSVAASADRDIKDASGLPANSVSFCYASAANSPGYEATILDVGGLRQDYRVQYAASYADGGKRLKFRTLNGDNGYWGSWTTVLTNYGGNVDYLDGAKYFAAKAEYWQGAGGFAHQYSNGTAPFFVRGFTSPAGVSNYFPLVKGSTVISGQGWGSAVSFGILRNGNNDFGSAVIHIIGDSGSGAIYGFDANGNFNSQGEVRAGTNIVASQGVYESGGAVRVYSSNNPPPLGAYATIDWVMNNFITDVALGAEGSFLIAKNAWQRAPAGCVLTGYNAEGNEPVNDTLFYRPIQKHIPSYGWINVGHTA